MTEGAVSVKAPMFYTKHPSAWFKQIESQFVLSKITNTVTKYHIALASLPEDVIGDIMPQKEDYDTLKETVLNSLRENKHKLIEQALAKMSLGSKRPTQLVAEIQRNFADIGLAAEEGIIKNRLMSALPSTIRSALVGHESQKLNDFAKIADSMLAVSSSDTPFTVSAVKHKEHPANATQSFRRNRASIKTDYKFAVRPFKPEQRPRLCNAHIFYAERARTCRPWCKWPGQKPRMMTRNMQTPAQTRRSSPVSN